MNYEKISSQCASYSPSFNFKGRGNIFSVAKFTQKWIDLKDAKKTTIIWPSSFQWEIFGVRVIVFNTTFNNISVILWWSVLLVEETRVPGENQIWFFMSKKEIIWLWFHWKINALGRGKNIALSHLKVKWSVSYTLPLQSRGDHEYNNAQINRGTVKPVLRGHLLDKEKVAI
jgi:hypothetical protein